MNAHMIRPFFGLTILVALLGAASSCAPPPQRVPLPVPLSAVGGSRPATPAGLQAFVDFGDGVWGQQGERVELGGGGAAVGIRDQFELSVSAYEPTRGRAPNQPTTLAVRGKIRVNDFMGGRASIGVHLANLSSTRQVSGVQDERMTALDLAIPIEFFPDGGRTIDRHLGLYVAPRLVSQTFEDRLAGETAKGTLVAGLVGLTAKWRHFALAGELNFAHTPTMGFGNTEFEGAWILLPVARASLIVPIGG